MHHEMEDDFGFGTPRNPECSSEFHEFSWFGYVTRSVFIADVAPLHCSEDFFFLPGIRCTHIYMGALCTLRYTALLVLAAVP